MFGSLSFTPSSYECVDFIREVSELSGRTQRFWVRRAEGQDSYQEVLGVGRSDLAALDEALGQRGHQLLLQVLPDGDRLGLQRLLLLLQRLLQALRLHQTGKHSLLQSNGFCSADHPEPMFLNWWVVAHEGLWSCSGNANPTSHIQKSGLTLVSSSLVKTCCFQLLM